jgi:hypothetical protein
MKGLNFSSLKSTLAKTGQAFQSVTAYDTLHCFGCGNVVSHTSVAVGLATYEQCRICGNKFCGKCITKDALPLPADLLVPEFRGKENVITWFCSNCQCVANDRWMQDFRTSIWTETESRLDAYLLNQQLQIFFDIPKPSEDSYKRKVERFAQLAEAAADIAGYKLYFNALKYAYYSKELYALLLAGDILNMLGPVVAELDRLGARSMGTKGVLQLYYLSCQHKLELKVDTSTEFGPFTRTEEQHLLSSECSEELLDRIGRYFDFAQFLYIAALPAPHHNQEWSSWYLAKLVRRQGWTVIACVNETTKLKNDRKCPAYALLARCQGSVKEAVVVIRGSKSVMDWSINLNEEPRGFTYYKGAGLANPVTGLGMKHFA